MDECFLISRLTFHLFLLSQVFTVQGANYFYCDLPINSRPISIPLEEYAKYCCKASGGGYSRFSCSDRGGCCGDKDDEHCCDLDDFAVQLGVGCFVGALVLLGIIALVVFCCVRSMFRSAGEEIYCTGCCKCATRPIEGTTEAVRYATRDGSTLDIGNTETWRPIEQRLQAHSGQYANAPFEPQVTSYPPDEAPPSYFEVVDHPEIYPETKNQKSNR